MPPRNRATQGDAQVKVEPASAAEPRVRATKLPAKQIDEALEKSAEYLQQQAEPPQDVHPKPTTPSKAEVAAAVEQAEERIQETATSTDAPAVLARDLTQDAAPVAAGGPDSTLAAQPASGARDKLMDATPVFTAPTTDTAKE